MPAISKKPQETPRSEDITDVVQDTVADNAQQSSKKTDATQGADVQDVSICDSGDGSDPDPGDAEQVSDTAQPTADEQTEADKQADSPYSVSSVFNVSTVNVPGGVRKRAGMTFTESGTDIDFTTLTGAQISKIRSDRFLRIKRVK